MAKTTVRLTVKDRIRAFWNYGSQEDHFLKNASMALFVLKKKTTICSHNIAAQMVIGFTDRRTQNHPTQRRDPNISEKQQAKRGENRPRVKDLNETVAYVSRKRDLLSNDNDTRSSVKKLIM